MFRRLDRRWRQAATVADLAALTADWLEGRLPGEHPGGYDRPDPETLPLVPTLAAANRAGFVTTGSQPGGTSAEGRVKWRQRAAVQGHIDPDSPLLDRILDGAQAAGVMAIQHGPGVSIGPEIGVVVTEVNGRPHTGFGSRLSRRDLDTVWRGIGREARAAIGHSTQLALIAPDYRDDNRLWRVLDEAVR
jgi:hypothetical protein